MYLNKTSDEVYWNENVKVQGNFELLNVIPQDHLMFSWKGEIIFDDFLANSYRVIILDEEHVYIRHFHNFWIENVKKI